MAAGGTKRRIGRVAADLLADGESVVLDSGTTALEVARCLAGRRVTVMPLSLHAASVLAQIEGVRLLMAGGEVRPGELSLVGPLATSSLATLRFDTAVMSCCGLADGQVTAHDLGDAEVKRAMRASASRTVLVADSSKFARSATAVVCATANSTWSSPTAQSRLRRLLHFEDSVSNSCLSEQVPVEQAEKCRNSRVPVVASFWLGAISASWAARIPAIRAPLASFDSSARVCSVRSRGGCGTRDADHRSSARAGVRPGSSSLAAFVPLVGVLPLVTVVGHVWQLFAVLFVWGSCVGVIDVAMNTEAVAVQDRIGRRVMSGFHASYSVGGLIGAAVGAGCAWGEISVRTQLVVVSVVVLVVGIVAADRFDPVRPATHAGQSIRSGGFVGRER